MTEENDLRWKQRLASYRKALFVLRSARDIVQKICGSYERLFEDLLETMAKYE